MSYHVVSCRISDNIECPSTFDHFSLFLSLSLSLSLHFSTSHTPTLSPLFQDWADKWRKNKRTGAKVADASNSSGGGGTGDVLLSILRWYDSGPKERKKDSALCSSPFSPFSLAFPLSPHTLPPISSMSNNPMLVKDKAFPLYEDNRKFKFSKMFRSNNVLQTLLKALKEYFGKQQQRLRWPALVGKGFHHYAPPVTIRYQR
jgi:hypothetical protein